MKINRSFLTITLSTLTLLSGELLGQEHYQMSKAEHQIVDSVRTSTHEQQVKLEEAQEDASRLADARTAQKETKAKAKEARRIERDAGRAAREANLALKGEKKAQKARRDADKQSKKADRAKDISDKN